jgi:hypothetical protein
MPFFNWMRKGPKSPAGSPDAPGPGLQPYAVFPIKRMRELYPEKRGSAREIPLTTFRGWLRQHRSENLNDTGRAVMRDVFPLFDEVPFRDVVARSNELASLGLPIPNKKELERGIAIESKGVKVVNRVHRRFAGSDGLLKRGSYYSVCHGPNGFDLFDLCRELYAYRDKRLPGTVFVGDSFDVQFLMAIRANDIAFKPGYSGVFILLLPPQDRRIWSQVYKNILGQNSNGSEPFCTLIETTHAEHEIDRVIDLRIPTVQKWFFEQFALGAPPWFTKEKGETLLSFFEMIPTLMHPQLGGVAATHGIGSWMRANKVNAFIFPSARADVAAKFRGGQLVEFTGWNLVDYRTSHDVQVEEGIVDFEPWEGFFHSHVKLVSESGTDTKEEVSWRVEGNELEYQLTRHQIIGN